VRLASFLQLYQQFSSGNSILLPHGYLGDYCWIHGTIAFSCPLRVLHIDSCLLCYFAIPKEMCEDSEEIRCSCVQMCSHVVIHHGYEYVLNQNVSVTDKREQAMFKCLCTDKPRNNVYHMVITVSYQQKVAYSSTKARKIICFGTD